MLDSIRDRNEKNIFRSGGVCLNFFLKSSKNNVEKGIFQVLVETKNPNTQHIKMKVNSVICIKKMLNEEVS